MSPQALTPAEIAARVERRVGGGGDSGAPVPAPTGYRWIQPFAEAAAGLVSGLQNPEGRLMFGISDLDLKVRGVDNGELCFVTGRAHSGKTQLVLQVIANNPNGRFLYFTPDEVDAAVLMKLACIRHGFSAEEIEERVQARDAQMVRMLEQVATVEFPNLIVIDKGIDFGSMRVALEEAEDFWGADCDGVFIDYLELLPGDADHDGVAWKVQELKRWTKDVHRPVVVLHQAKRGGRGKSVGMDGMRYGGENEATFVLEVYRKCQDEDLDEYERQMEMHTISVNVAKNKRPPCKTGECNLFIDPNHGGIRTLREGDRSPLPSAKPDQAHTPRAVQIIQERGQQQEAF